MVDDKLELLTEVDPVAHEGAEVLHLADLAGPARCAGLGEPDPLRAHHHLASIAAQAAGLLPLEQVDGADEAGDEGGGGGVVDSIRRGYLLDLALIEDADAVAHGERLLLIVGDEDEGDAELALQGFQLELHLLAQLEVQRPQGFVQQQDARLVDEGPGDGDALALAAGELARFAAADAGQAHQLQHLLHLAVALRLGHTPDHQAVADVVPHIHVGEEGVVLEHGVEVAIIGWHPGAGLAKQPDLPLARVLEARDHPQAGGLAGTARPQQGEEFSGRDLEGDVVDRLHLAIVAADPVKLYGCHGTSLSSNRAGSPPGPWWGDLLVWTVWTQRPPRMAI
ncbi:hypothetical protein D3C75_425850 [compost metagenome]